MTTELFLYKRIMQRHKRGFIAPEYGFMIDKLEFVQGGCQSIPHEACLLGKSDWSGHQAHSPTCSCAQ